MKRIALVAMLALAALCRAGLALAAGEYRDERVQIRLLAEHAAIRPGAPVSLGLAFDLADHWHVYWRNPGDSGEPPKITWTKTIMLSTQPIPTRLVGTIHDR